MFGHQHRHFSTTDFRRGLKCHRYPEATGPRRTSLWYAVTHMVTAVHKGLLDSLREDLGYRRIGDGMARLDAYWEQVSGRVDLRDPDSACLLCYVAQWVD